MDAFTTYQAPSTGVKQPSVPPPPSRAWPVPKVTGQNVAKGRRTKAQRIYLAEALAAGTFELTRPTLKQSAALARVPVAEIYRARRARKPKPSLAEHLANSSPAERIEAARKLGVDKVWDEMIAPLIAEGGPSTVVKSTVVAAAA